MMKSGNMRCSTTHTGSTAWRHTHIMATVGLWQRQCGFLASTAAAWRYLCLSLEYMARKIKAGPLGLSNRFVTTLIIRRQRRRGQNQVCSFPCLCFSRQDVRGCGEPTVQASGGSSEQVSTDIRVITDTQGEDRRAWVGALSSSGDGERLKLFTHLSPRASSPRNRGHLLSL